MRHRSEPRRLRARILAGAAALLGCVGVALMLTGLFAGSAMPEPTIAPLPAPTVHSPSPESSTTARATPPDGADGVEPMDAAEPVRITIPALDMSAPIMHLGLLPDGSLEVPPGADRAGWYVKSPTPGELGPSIIAAHINWNGDPGPFADLPELEPGDRVVIARADGSTAVFAITRLEQYDKDNFHTQEVYGDIDHAGLRLITCGGEFIESKNSYEDNIVAYARLVAARSA